LPDTRRGPNQEAASVTSLLLAWSQGDASALDRLVPLVYKDLRRVAQNHLRVARRGHTLSATSLVHEAYMRLVDQRAVQWQNRAQFFAIASEMMRRILVDHARRRAAAKRGGGQLLVTLDAAVAAAAERDVELLSLDSALDELAALDGRSARVVEMRFFGGLSVEEAAFALGVSRATVERDWSTARAWLFRRLGPAAAGTPGNVP
jgi:RNA polymerase sigma factor (TIGR02999 family)